MKKAAIIIVNWNGKKFLKDCLNAVYNQTYKNFDVYFVDNGSIDDSLEYVRKSFPKTKIIQLDKNYGFAKGNNIAIKESLKDKEIKYIVCLNNDTIVNKNWLKELIKTAEKDKKIGMVTSKSYFKEGTIQNAGLSFEKALQVNKNGGISVGYGKREQEIKVLLKDIEIFAACGVAPLYKRKLLEEIYKQDGEFFDEDFFAYAEDLDIGFRARLLGWKAVLSSNAKLIHLHSQTGKKASQFKAYYSERNTILTAIKNLPILLFLKFMYSNLKLKLSYILKNNDSVQKLKGDIGFSRMFFVLVRAYLSAFYYTPKMLIKRYKIQSNKRVSNRDINEWFNKFNRDVIEK